MIYDCFTLRDELDLLELRLKLLDNYVDKFVISEANKSFTNINKEYTYHLNKERFKQWEEKIIYLPIKLDDSGLDFTIKDTTYTGTSAAWQFEYQQRNALFYGLKDITDDDIIMIGDLDEIPNLKNLPSKIITPKVFVQNFYYYFFNYKSIGPQDQVWGGTVVTLGKDFTTPQDMRNNRNYYQPIMNGGWHWSYMGGKEFIKRKIQTISHTEFNHPQYYSDENINECLIKGKDIFNRPGMNFTLIQLEREYPKEIYDIIKEYKQFIYEN
jgi:beta-1,4-mannosyl-glycoprotein beta-1,4-N-acetylglucosaminyltransferase